MAAPEGTAVGCGGIDTLESGIEECGASTDLNQMIVVMGVDIAKFLETVTFCQAIIKGT